MLLRKISLPMTHKGFAYQQKCQKTCLRWRNKMVLTYCDILCFFLLYVLFICLFQSSYTHLLYFMPHSITFIIFIYLYSNFLLICVATLSLLNVCLQVLEIFLQANVFSAKPIVSLDHSTYSMISIKIFQNKGRHIYISPLHILFI